MLPAIVISLAIASKASAQTTIIEPMGSHFPYQRWVDEAKVPTPPERLTVSELAGPCTDALGCVDADTIYLPGVIYLSAAELRKVFLHEMGHAFDDQVLTEADHEAFEEIIGEHSEWIWADDSPESPQEVFAESYSYCARRPIWRISGSVGVGIVVGHARMRAACRWLRTV